MEEIIISKKKKAIRNLTLEQIKEAMTSHGQPGFRAKQIYEWIWNKSARNFEQMQNIPKELRAWLDDEYVLNCVEVEESQISSDRTIKSSFILSDGHLVEGVLIPTDDRMTACVSSQVGCSLTCSFCATGYMERKRNLEPHEIYDQVVLIRNQAESTYQQPLTNIVYMGMGEPL